MSSLSPLAHVLLPGEVDQFMNNHHVAQGDGYCLDGVCAQHSIDHETRRCLHMVLAGDGYYWIIPQYGQLCRYPMKVNDILTTIRVPDSAEVHP